MKNNLNSSIIRFAAFGFLISLAAPISYYLYGFILNHINGMTFWNYLISTNQHDTGTVLFISFGTTTTFTLFGAILGKYSNELALAHKNTLHLKQTKKSLEKYYISRMRVPTTIAIESLLHLKENNFSDNEYESLFQSFIEELYRIDQMALHLIELQDHDTENEHKITESEIIDYIKNSCEKYDIQFGQEILSCTQKGNHINVKGPFFSLAIDHLFEWVNSNEMQLNQVVIDYFMGPHQNLNNPLIVSMEFKVSGHNLQNFEAPILVDFIEKSHGICYYNNESIFILLPAEKHKEEVKAA